MNMKTNTSWQRLAATAKKKKKKKKKKNNNISYTTESPNTDIKSDINLNPRLLLFVHSARSVSIKVCWMLSGHVL